MYRVHLSVCLRHQVDCTGLSMTYSIVCHYAWYDELKFLKGSHVCRSNTHPDMKSHVIERLATDHCSPSAHPHRQLMGSVACINMYYIDS